MMMMMMMTSVCPFIGWLTSSVYSTGSPYLNFPFVLAAAISHPYLVRASKLKPDHNTNVHSNLNNNFRLAPLWRHQRASLWAADSLLEQHYSLFTAHELTWPDLVIRRMLSLLTTTSQDGGKNQLAWRVDMERNYVVVTLLYIDWLEWNKLVLKACISVQMFTLQFRFCVV